MNTPTIHLPWRETLHSNKLLVNAIGQKLWPPKAKG